MPSVSFEGEIIEVLTSEESSSAITDLLSHSIVGIDTETRPAFKKGLSYPVSLLQVSTLSRCYLFRLNLLDDFSEIKRLFESSSTMKIGLSIHDDLRALCGRIKDFNPKSCIDIQDIVKDYGIFELSLQKIFAILFHHKISKAQRLTNWDAEQLSKAQQQYAATDAWATLLLYQQLIRCPKITEQEKQTIQQQLALMEDERLNAQKIRKEQPV